MAYNHTTGDGERIFSPLYADVWDTTLKHLNGAAVKVYIALLMHTTQQDRTWFMSIDEIAADAGVGRSAASAGKDKLIEVGLIEQSWRYRDEAGDYHLTDTRPPPRMQGKNVYKVNVKPRATGSENQNHEGGHRVRKSDSIGSENQTLVGSENQTQTITPTPEPPTEPLSPLTPQGGTTGGELDVIESIPVPEKPTGRIKYPPEFNALWDAYPKRTGSKKRAYAQYQKAVKRVSYEELRTAIHALSEWVRRNHKDPKYVVDAERWFRDDRWDDELIDEQARQNSPRRTNTVEAWLGIPEGALGGQGTFGGFDTLRDNTIDGQVIDQRELGR